MAILRGTQRIRYMNTNVMPLSIQCGGLDIPVTVSFVAYRSWTGYITKTGVTAMTPFTRWFIYVYIHWQNDWTLVRLSTSSQTRTHDISLYSMKGKVLEEWRSSYDILKGKVLEWWHCYVLLGDKHWVARWCNAIHYGSLAMQSPQERRGVTTRQTFTHALFAAREMQAYD